jgi:hypothetical protein
MEATERKPIIMQDYRKLIEDKPNSPLAKALLEDEASRLASENKLKLTLEKRDEEDSSVPFWMWCAIWFILGIFFGLTTPDTIATLWYNYSTYGTLLH